MASKRQIKANRTNSRKSTGPKDTSTSKWNAVRHGLLSQALTELDDEDMYAQVLRDLTNRIAPEGRTEECLIRNAALDLVGWKRAQMIEAEFIISQLHPATREEMLDLSSIIGRVLDPGVPSTLSVAASEHLLLYQRYETFFSNRLFRTLHEIERIQALRKGEHLVPPIPIDVSHSVRRFDSEGKRPQASPSVEEGERPCGVAEPSALGSNGNHETNPRPATPEEVEKDMALTPPDRTPKQGGTAELSTAKATSTPPTDDESTPASRSGPRPLWRKGSPEPPWRL